MMEEAGEKLCQKVKEVRVGFEGEEEKKKQSIAGTITYFTCL